MPLPSGTPRFIVSDTRWAKWTADGRGIFFSRNKDTELYRVNADGSDIRFLATLKDISFLESAPDGLRLRFSVDPTFELWEVDADGSHAHPVLPGRGRIQHE